MTTLRDTPRIRRCAEALLDPLVAAALAVGVAINSRETLLSLFRSLDVVAWNARDREGDAMIAALLAAFLVLVALLLSRRFPQLPQWPRLSTLWQGAGDAAASGSDSGRKRGAPGILVAAIIVALLADFDGTIGPILLFALCYGGYRLIGAIRRYPDTILLTRLETRIDDLAMQRQHAPAAAAAPWRTLLRAVRRNLAGLPGSLTLQPLRLVFAVVDSLHAGLRPLAPLFAYALALLWRVTLLCTLAWVVTMANVPAAAPQPPAIASESTTTPWAAVAAGDSAALRRALGDTTPDATDWQGRTLLMAALEELANASAGGRNDALEARRAVVDMLLEPAPDLEARDRAGRSLPMLAVTAGYVPDRLAPKNPADVTHLGTNLLHAAAASGNVALAQRMAALGVPVAAAAQDGRTPLHFARGADMARYLLRQGLSPDAVDARDRTPFHYAVMHGDIDAAWLLGGLGTDKGRRDIFGKTAFDYIRPDMLHDARTDKRNGAQEKEPSPWRELREKLSPRQQNRSGEWK